MSDSWYSSPSSTRGIPNRGADDLGVKRCIPIGDVGVEGESGLGAVSQVDGAGVLTAAAHRIALAIGGRGGAATPVYGERQLVRAIYEFRQRLGVGFIAHVPRPQGVELMKRGSWAGLRHFVQAQIDGIGQEDCE